MTELQMAYAALTAILIGCPVILLLMDCADYRKRRGIYRNR